MAKLALLLGLALAAAAPADALTYTELPTGRYEVTVSGMLCAVCARAITAEWEKLPAVKSARVDFATGRAVVTVRLAETAKVSDLESALRRAERVANLGTDFRLTGIRYLP